MKNDSCSIHPQFSSVISACYAPYAVSEEDTERFGPGFRTFTSADAWRYQSPKELGHIDYWGKMTTFSGGGSIQDLDNDRETTEKIIRVSYDPLISFV